MSYNIVVMYLSCIDYLRMRESDVRMYLYAFAIEFALMGAFVNWFPLISGMTINPILLKTQFLVMFIGVNLTFFPMHFLGLAGIPRRYSDYPDFYAG